MLCLICWCLCISTNQPSASYKIKKQNWIFIVSNRIFKHAFIIIFLSSVPLGVTKANAATSDNIIENYKDSNGKIRPITMEAKLDSSNVPVVENYKDNNGKWKEVLITQQICGLDENSHPIACGSDGVDSSGNINSPIYSPMVNSTVANLTSTGVNTPILSIGGKQSSYALPGQNSDPYVPPHALWLGSQRAGASTSSVATDNLGTGSSIVLRGRPDGFMDLGCLTCTVTTNKSVFDTRAGLSTNLTSASNIANDPSFDTVVHYDQTGNDEPVIVVKGVTYDATHIFLPSGSPLDTQQIARIHPNMYITTNSISNDVSQQNNTTTDSGLQNPSVGGSINNHNYFVSTVSSVSPDGKSITVNGWGIMNGNNTGHPWKTNDIPTSNYDTVRNNFGQAVAMIGSPTQTGGRNLYMTFDPVANPDSLIDYLNGDELDLHYNGDKSNEATMRGIVIAFDCEGSAAPSSGVCYHPTYDSVGLEINGNNLPNGIKNTVSGWANEYKGYNFYIPGSEAPSLGKNNSHTSFETRTPTSIGTNVLVTRSWVTQNDAATSPIWSDYQVNLGLVIDGKQWDSSANTGTNMGMLSFNFNSANLGGVCLIGNNTASGDSNAPGLCVRGNGDVWSAGAFRLANNSPLMGASSSGNNGIGATLAPDDSGNWNVGTQVSGGGNIKGVNTYFGTVLQVPYIEGVSLIRTGTNQSLDDIKNSSHEVSDRVWCNDCLNVDQAAGAGSGRWIFMDNKNTWRSDDGAVAAH